MTHRLGWGPFTAKVDHFQAEIGGHEQFVAGGRPKDGAIVTNSCDHGPSDVCGPSCETAHVLD